MRACVAALKVLLLAKTREVGSSGSRLAFTAAGVSRASCRRCVCPEAVAEGQVGGSALAAACSPLRQRKLLFKP